VGLVRSTLFGSPLCHGESSEAQRNQNDPGSVRCVLCCVSRHAILTSFWSLRFSVVEACSGPNLGSALTQHLKGVSTSTEEHLALTHRLLLVAASSPSLADPASRAAQDVVSFSVDHIHSACKDSQGVRGACGKLLRGATACFHGLVVLYFFVWLTV